MTSLNKETNLEEQFSFMDQRSSLEPLLYTFDRRQSIVEDATDFWQFLQKYEHMMKRLRGHQTPAQTPLMEKHYHQLTPYHKLKTIPLTLLTTNNEDQHRPGRQEIKSRERQFLEIVLIYLDFKQKERFARIKKLRKAQRNLPMWQFKHTLAQGLQETQVLIVAGDTGCGKSTQVPQYLYEFGYRSIACTQPRRLACVSLSKRVAHEMLDGFGSKVGFQIRFEKHKTSRTHILFITEGLLLRQLALESNLEQYDVLILDEIHERNLFGDFLLGVVKCLLHARPQLKVILMSATINVELFYGYFKEEGARLLEVPGRLHPIKTVFMPPPSLELHRSSSSRASRDHNNQLDPAPYVQILNLIDQKYSVQERGDVLVFVSGVKEITIVCEAAKEYAEQQNHWIILPLHSGLSLAEQDKVFDYAADGMRKCIVSTNIAETSITVDGIRFVVDSGKVKEMSYDASCKGQRLKEFWVSQSSAEQRKGRAGRTGPGTCFRLYSEQQFKSFEPYPTPEIFRVPLDSILLQMISMGLPNVRKFPFLESPNQENIEQTLHGLKQHNALTAEERVTALGRALSNLPVEICVGKMLLMGCVFPDMEKILTLAALISVTNPFTNRAYTDRTCEDARLPYESDHGDIFILLSIYHEWLQRKYEHENTRSWCHKLGIEEQRFYEATKLRGQFESILEDGKMLVSRFNDDQLSRTDRMRRHGEVRRLKAIKRRQRQEQPRQRKILKHPGGMQEEGGDDEQGETKGEDIRDVDFRLQNNAAKLEMLMDSCHMVKGRDVLLLKLILVSGFYPQIAIADDFNYCKEGSGQQFYHTFQKAFISIHPNAYFARNFEQLRLKDSDILPEKPTYYTPRACLSEAHQILCYQQLLETAKPYLTNCVRLPAASTLLLFSYNIDTNLQVTRIVCDSWLCLEFPLPETGLRLLRKAIRLRRKWNSMLMQKLTDLSQEEEQPKGTTTTTNPSNDEELWQDLVDFVSSRVPFTIKRLLPADQKQLYNRHHYQYPLEHRFKTNPFAEDYPMTNNEEKGGLNVCENVVYGCLMDPEWCDRMNAHLKDQFSKCRECEKKIPLDVMDLLAHQTRCSGSRRKHSSSKVVEEKKKGRTTAAEEEEKREITNKSLNKCPDCGQELPPNSKIEMLRHKKQCNRR